VPTISIITAVHDGGHHYLCDTYESLLRQEMPAGWDWQWLVQEDGQTGNPAAKLPADDSRLSLGSGRAGRAPMARTMALARAEGVLVRALDADDMLTDGALWRDIDTLTRHPDMAWCVSACVDLMPDGTRVPGPYDPEPGALPPRVLYEGHQRGQLPVMGTTLTTYTDLVCALGGWFAIPAMEDVALLLACEAVTSGWMIGEVSEVYRKHTEQSTACAAYADQVEASGRNAALYAHVDALYRSRWSWNVPVYEWQREVHDGVHI